MIMSNKEVITALPKEKILEMVEFNGSVYPRTDWHTIKDVFVDKDIIFTDSVPVDDDRIFICTLLNVCDLDVKDTVLLSWLDKGVRVEALRNVNSICFVGIV